MTGALKTLRAVQWSMLASIVMYALLGELAGPGAKPCNPTLNYVFSTLSVAIVGVIFVVRRTLVLRSAQSLAAHPEDGISLNHWRTGYLVTYVLCEAMALFGIVLRFMGCTFQQSLPFYVGGFVLLSFFGPRVPASA